MVIEAIYQNGVIKPLRNVELRENERIQIEITRFPLQEPQKSEGKKVERILQTTSSVDRQVLLLDEHEYKEFEAIFTDLLTDPKLLENSKKLEPDEDGTSRYMRLVNVLNEDLYIMFSVHDSVVRVTSIIHKETVDRYKKQLAARNTTTSKDEKTSED